MAGETVAVASPLHGSLALDLALEHITSVACFTFLDFHAFGIGGLFAIWSLGVMALGAFDVFLVLGMGEYNGFFTIGIDGNVSRSLVSCQGHTCQTGDTDKGRCCRTNHNFFHLFLLRMKMKLKNEA